MTFSLSWKFYTLTAKDPEQRIWGVQSGGPQGSGHGLSIWNRTHLRVWSSRFRNLEPHISLLEELYRTLNFVPRCVGKRRVQEYGVEDGSTRWASSGL